MDRWELENKIEKIIEKNCVEIPWEGTDVNKTQLKEDILELMDSIKKEK